MNENKFGLCSLFIIHLKTSRKKNRMRWACYTSEQLFLLTSRQNGAHPIGVWILNAILIWWNERKTNQMHNRIRIELKGRMSRVFLIRVKNWLKFYCVKVDLVSHISATLNFFGRTGSTWRWWKTKKLSQSTQSTNRLFSISVYVGLFVSFYRNSHATRCILSNVWIRTKKMNERWTKRRETPDWTENVNDGSRIESAWLWSWNNVNGLTANSRFYVNPFTEFFGNVDDHQSHLNLKTHTVSTKQHMLLLLFTEDRRRTTTEYESLSSLTQNHLWIQATHHNPSNHSQFIYILSLSFKRFFVFFFFSIKKFH